MTRFERPRLVVVKVGSSSLRTTRGRLDRDQVASLSAQVGALRTTGVEVVVVSSGAVAAGMGLLGLDSRPADLPGLQACAAAGQGELIHTWQVHVAEHGGVAAQILLSQDDFVTRGRYLNARTTLRRLLDLGCVPVINENDAVATEELAYGDNDHLAALVASMLDAGLLILLSDVDGLFDGDPRNGSTTRLVDIVASDEDLAGIAITGSATTVGSGGMATKVGSARIATASACHAVVANARRDGVIGDVVAGAPVGTWFVAHQRRMEARRLWIGFALGVRGTVVVDDGAVAALRDGKRSLLPVGVTEVAGDFDDGDAIEVVGPDGVAVARGLTRFTASGLRRVAGMSTTDIVTSFGPGSANAVVHRDDLTVLPT